jgi:hypothetical protein
MLISKMQTCLSDKMPPKKVKMKQRKKKNLAKLEIGLFNFNPLTTAQHRCVGFICKIAQIFIYFRSA